MAPPKSRMLDIALGLGTRGKPAPMGPVGDEPDGDDDGGDKPLSQSQTRCAHDAMAALQAGDAEAFGEAVLALVKDDGSDDEEEDQPEQPEEGDEEGSEDDDES